MVPSAKDLQAKKLEADEMYDACRMVCHELAKANPYTARDLGHTGSDEKVRQFDNELDGARKSEAYWAGVLSALKDRATGFDRTRQTRS
jgi:hypothetical protein